MSEPHIPWRRIEEAAERIRPWVHRTPVFTCRGLDQLAGGKLFFKCENLQKVGAFKIRGATNAVFSLSEDEAARGVVTHSSGNHGAALALAARNRGVSAYVVMPETSSAVKKRAVEAYGAEITYCAPNDAARQQAAAEIEERTGATLIHPFDDPRIIAGQGTAALELMEDVPDLDLVLAPVGGGGLAAGTCLAVHGRDSQCRVIAAEPAGADDTFRSFGAGKRLPLERADTVADGLRTSVGELTFPILQEHLEDVVTVSDEETLAAMRVVWERMKLVIEPSAAVPVAAVLSGKIEIEGQRVAMILSGGNVDLDRLPW